jgi:hypothetical protein
MKSFAHLSISSIPSLVSGVHLFILLLLILIDEFYSFLGSPNDSGNQLIPCIDIPCINQVLRFRIRSQNVFGKALCAEGLKTLSPKSRPGARKF